jgi:glycosyltransferase involved in cell wall biosynthesis
MGIMYPVFIKLIKLFADEILCVSEAVRNDVGVSPKAMVVYTDTISEKLPGWEGLKSPESASIIYVANYISGKGHIWAIYAMAEVVRKYPKIRLTFIGSMTEHYQEKYKQSLQMISTNMGLQKNIFFEGPAENVEKRMKDADLVLNLSESESFSMVCSGSDQFWRAIESVLTVAVLQRSSILAGLDIWYQIKTQQRQRQQSWKS